MSDQAPEMPLFENARPNIQEFLDFGEGNLFGQEFLDSGEGNLFGPEYSERIVSSSSLEALEELLDGSNLQYGEDLEARLKDSESSWTIVAYRPDTCSPGEAHGWASNAAETLRESFGEEYGDEDGDDRLTDADIAELDRRMAEVVDWYVSRAKVWRCEQIRTFTFDGEDVLQMVQELRPDWLNKKSERDV